MDNAKNNLINDELASLFEGKDFPSKLIALALLDEDSDLGKELLDVRVTAATKILKEITKSIDEKEEIEPIYLEYLANCLKQITEFKEDPKKALRINRSQGRPMKHSVRVDIYYLIEALKSDGMTIKDSISFVATLKFMSEDDVESKYYAIKNEYMSS